MINVTIFITKCFRESLRVRLCIDTEMALQRIFAMSFCPFTLYINAAAYGFIFRRNCKNKSCSEPLSKYKSAFTWSKDHKLEKNENMVPFWIWMNSLNSLTLKIPHPCGVFLRTTIERLINYFVTHYCLSRNYMECHSGQKWSRIFWRPKYIFYNREFFYSGWLLFSFLTAQNWQ